MVSAHNFCSDNPSSNPLNYKFSVQFNERTKINEKGAGISPFIKNLGPEASLLYNNRIRIKILT